MGVNFMEDFKIVEWGKQIKDFNPNYRKPDSYWCSYKALDNNFREYIDCRFYATKGGTVYCCIWVYCGIDSKTNVSGFSASGKAGGWGYDKKSAALQEALTNADIKLNHNIWGTGEIKRPLEAIAKYISGKRSIHIIESYG